MGMGMAMGQRVQVLSTGAASLFTLPDLPREDVTAYSADATKRDEADEKAARSRNGGAACDTPACARVQLQRLRNANALALPLGANVTAGGDEVPCEFQVTSRDALRAMSIEEREAMLTRFPTLIRGLTAEWPAMTRWSDPQQFSQRYGHHRLKAIRASHGFGKLSRLGGQQCSNFDESLCPGQANATLPLAEILPFTSEEQLVLMDLPDMNLGEYELLTDVSTEYELPEFLEALSNIRLLSVGGRPEGVQMSRHHSAWLATIAGAKLWHLAPPDVPQPRNRNCPSRGKIDYELAKRENVVHCVANVGDVVVVPDNWWHATCNMLPYTMAVGGQTWDRAAGRAFAERTDAARAETARRWREGVPRPLNHFQREIASELTEGERLPSVS